MASGHTSQAFDVFSAGDDGPDIADSITAEDHTSNVPEDSDNQSVSPKATRDHLLTRLLRFVFHDGTLSLVTRLFLLIVLLAGLGVLGAFYFPQAHVWNFKIHVLLLTSAFFFVGLCLFIVCLHIILLAANRYRCLYNWDIVHYIAELEVHIALLLWIVTLLILISVSGTFADTLDHYIFGDLPTQSLTTKVLAGVLLTVFLLAIKRHLMTSLAMSFNYSNYRDRIQECLFADEVLESLMKAKHTYKFRRKLRSALTTSGATPARLLNIRRRRSYSGDLNAIDVEATQATHPVIRKTINAPDMVERTVLSAEDVVVVVDHATDGGSGHQATPPTSSQDSKSPEATSSHVNAAKAKASLPGGGHHVKLTESDKKRQFDAFYRLANKVVSHFSLSVEFRTEVAREAKRKARKLFKYLRPPGKDYVLPADLQPFFDSQDQFKKAFLLLRKYSESFQTGTARDTKVQADYAFGEYDLRRAIDGMLTELFVVAKSMQTVETALDKVDVLFTVLVFLVLIIILAVVLSDAIQLLLSLSTVLSGAAFAFGTSARNMFESMIFLLVIHPFDVGDRVFVPLGTTSIPLAATAATMAGTDALDNLVVVEMHLLSTVFERWDGVRVYVPNYVLSAKPVFNIRRSGPLIELQRMQIDFSTPLAKIDELRRRLDQYVKSDTADFTDISRVFIDTIENCNKINVIIIFQHSSNWQDLGTQLHRRSKVMSFIKTALEDIEITYYPPLQRIALVPAGSLSSRGDVGLGQFVTAAEANRLVEIGQQLRCRATAPV